MLANVGNDLRREFDGPGFAGDVRRDSFSDQPIVAAIDPGIETVCAHQIDRLARYIGRHSLFVQDCEISFDKQPAVEPGDRRFDIEHVK